MPPKPVKEIAGGGLVSDGSGATFHIVREGGTIVTLEFPREVLIRFAQQVSVVAAKAQELYHAASGLHQISVQRTTGFEVRLHADDLVLTLVREDGFQEAFAIPLAAVPQLQADIADPPGKQRRSTH